MTGLVNKLICLMVDESGPTATEYAIMLALVIVALVATISAFEHEVYHVFKDVGDKVGV